MRKVPILLILLATAALAALAQNTEKPKAYLFDEFQSDDKNEVVTRTNQLKGKLREIAHSKAYENVYIFFFYAAKRKPSFDVRGLIYDTLYADCRDCFGIDPPR